MWSLNEKNTLTACLYLHIQKQNHHSFEISGSELEQNSRLTENCPPVANRVTVSVLIESINELISTASDPDQSVVFLHY